MLAIILLIASTENICGKHLQAVPTGSAYKEYLRELSAGALTGSRGVNRFRWIDFGIGLYYNVLISFYKQYEGI